MLQGVTVPALGGWHPLTAQCAEAKAEGGDDAEGVAEVKAGAEDDHSDLTSKALHRRRRSHKPRLANRAGDTADHQDDEPSPHSIHRGRGGGLWDEGGTMRDER